jgi:molybdopterin molybdotransferase
VISRYPLDFYPGDRWQGWKRLCLLCTERREPLLDYYDALKTILESISPLEKEEKNTVNCLNQVLAEDIVSGINLPVKDSSVFDGYAVRSQDISLATPNNPVVLKVIETVRAGIQAVNRVSPGTAIRIMTGCLLPSGADCVVRFEDTDEPPNKSGPNPRPPECVKIFVSGVPGLNLRKAGSSVTRGALLLPRGSLIGPNQLSVLLAIGKDRVKVVRQPQVAVISTGDELVAPGFSFEEGKVYNSNSAVLASMVTWYGGKPELLGVAHDYESSITSKIRKGVACDCIISSGGVSRGDYDLLRVFMKNHGEIKFSRVNLGPGASFCYGIIKTMSEKLLDRPVPLFALSGPPQGCFINFETLVRPALLKMRGISQLEHPSVTAISDDSSPDSGSKPILKWSSLRRENGEFHVRLNDADKKGLLDSIARANSLTFIPQGTAIRKGEKVRVLVLDWCRDLPPLA